ncbi:PREDICTED: coiled-coil domain-containing protein 112-like [Papilio polytes]|uniref:coiled-coil domain-containing protein 112-like n=1 Tax=Papilio polytes TaxID=76194 RepID=UPI0006763B16|nr:PREDICTED: coiled-coil domain-containing protein 112-like [Papilio polytes]
MSKSSNPSYELDNITLAKLRRLKIQENILTSSVNKSLSKLGLNDDDFATFKATIEFKKYESSLQSNLIEIKNLLEDVKIATDARGDIEKLDIDEVKRDVLRLEEKLRTFKTYLRSELTALKISANEIEHELLINQKEKKELKKSINKSRVKKFTEIVPSPVRILRNSPFKCPEVQRFQEFVSNSKRYNGWNEYNHNIFIQIWSKHFNTRNIEANTNDIKNVEQFDQFKDEVMSKISGLNCVDVTSHYKWYSQYIYLKNKQQEALEKWKEDREYKQNRRISRQEAKQVSRSNRSSESSNNIDKRFSTKQTLKDNSKNVDDTIMESYSKSRKSLKSPTNYKNEDDYDGFSRLLKSTEQWRNKCLGEKDKMQIFSAPTIDKRQLGIPSWRLGLQDI